MPTAKRKEFPITRLTFHLTLCSFILRCKLKILTPQDDFSRAALTSRSSEVFLKPPVSAIAIYRQKPRRSHPSLTVLNRPFFPQKPHQFYILSFYPATARVRTLIFAPFTHCRPES